VKRAVVVADGQVHTETALGSLAAAGCEGVTVAGTAEARAAAEAGALVIVLGVADGRLDGERAAPLQSMPPTVRRGGVIALGGDGLSTGDGMQAFSHGVDLVVARGDLSRVGELAAAVIASKRTLVAQLDPTAAARLGA